MLAVTFVRYLADANCLTDDVQLLANRISQTQANTEQATKTTQDVRASTGQQVMLH